MSAQENDVKQPKQKGWCVQCQSRKDSLVLIWPTFSGDKKTAIARYERATGRPWNEKGRGIEAIKISVTAGW